MEMTRRRNVGEGREEVTFRPRGASWITRTQKAIRRYDLPFNKLMHHVLVLVSWLCFFLTLPFSIIPAFKVAKEYERAVIFRIGRLKKGTGPWGVKVVRVEVKDIRLPANLLRVMAAEAEATREASARLIHARGEEAAANKMIEAAEILGEHPLAITLRYFQAIRASATEKKSTIVFPLPTNLPNWKLKEAGKKLESRDQTRFWSIWP